MEDDDIAKNINRIPDIALYQVSCRRIVHSEIVVLKI